MPDDEVFSSKACKPTGWCRALQQQFVADWEARAGQRADGDVAVQLLQQRIHSLQRAGQLPLAGLGQREAQALQDSALHPACRRGNVCAPRTPKPRRASACIGARRCGQLEDWMDATAGCPPPVPGVLPLWLLLDPRDVRTAKGRYAAIKLLPVYIRSVVAAACGDARCWVP